MTTAIRAHHPVGNFAAFEHDDFLSAVASINALGRRRDTVLVESKPRRRPTEEEIAQAAITVIFVSLVALIGLVAAAFLMMA